MFWNKIWIVHRKPLNPTVQKGFPSKCRATIDRKTVPSTRVSPLNMMKFYSRITRAHQNAVAVRWIGNDIPIQKTIRFTISSSRSRLRYGSISATKVRCIVRNCSSFSRVPFKSILRRHIQAQYRIWKERTIRPPHVPRKVRQKLDCDWRLVSSAVSSLNPCLMFIVENNELPSSKGNNLKIQFGHTQKTEGKQR